MKKQINPTIKAHLIRSAFYVILLLAVCVIPFALAQRNTVKRSVAKGASSRVSGTATSSRSVPSRPSSIRKAGEPQAQPRLKATTGTQFSHAPRSGASKQPRKVLTRPSGTVCPYDFTVGTDTFVPGVDDIGNHGDDVGVIITLPFSVTLYGQTFTSADAGSNGHLTFGTPYDSFGITCSPFGNSAATDALAPYWGDQCTGACASITCDTCGIFTTTTGSAPDRIFYIEWRTQYYNQAETLNYEVALYENGNPPFKFIYNSVNAAGLPNDSELVVGQKQDDVCFTEFGCDPSGGQNPPVASGQALTAVPAATPGVCGLLVGSGMTTGFLPNGWEPTLAGNTVNYTFANGPAAPNEFALFETHDPWGFTVIKDAITGNGHTYTEFTPADLTGFDFSQYSVVILNWDDTVLSDFGGSAACGGGPHINTLPALEAYSAAGGVVWVQGAIQGNFGDCYPLPFGGQACIDFSFEDPIVQACHPMMIGVDDPIEGNYASHTSQTGLPPASNVVVINGSDSNSVVYELACATPQPTPTPIPPLGCNTGLIHNGGFETGDFTTWVIDGTIPSPVVTNALSHSGRFSAFAGGNPPLLQFCGFGGAASGDSSFYQQFGPVPANATLSFWHWDCNTSFGIDFAWQDAYITDTDGNILQTIYHQMLSCQSWVNQRVDLTPWVGQTIGVKFLVHEDGFGDLTSTLVDDVGVFVAVAHGPGTPRPTPTPRGQPTPHPRP